MLDAPQGSNAWLQARCGSIGASDVPRLIRKTKAGAFSADRATLLAEKVLERLTGVPNSIPKTAAMLQGTEREPIARLTYSLIKNVEVEEVTLIVHPRIKGSHASPDGFVDSDGLLEAKCPQPAAHLDTLLNETISADYTAQMQWQMAVTDRSWCDYCSFNPDFPTPMQLWVKRVPRDDKFIAALEKDVQGFIREIQLRIDRLTVRYAA